MKFTQTNPKPSDRSIFRKRALLNKQNDYLKVWEIDFTGSAKRANHSHLRNIEKVHVWDSEYCQTSEDVFCTLNAEEVEPTQTDIVNNTRLIRSGIRATADIV
jgi:hypothetical protein